MSDDYTGHLLEQILDEVKAVHELVAGQPTRGEFKRHEQKVDKLSDGMEVVKVAVKATNSDVAEVKREVQISALRVSDIERDLDEHVHLPAHGREMLKQ